MFLSLLELPMRSNKPVGASLVWPEKIFGILTYVNCGMTDDSRIGSFMPEQIDFLDLPVDVPQEIGFLLQQYPDIKALRYQDGEYLIREQEASQEVFIVLRGGYVVERETGMFSSGNVSEVALVISEPSDISFVGEMAYLGSIRRTASVRSSGATFVLCLQPSHLDLIIDRFERLRRILFRQFTDRLRQANDALMRLRNQFSMNTQKVMLNEGQLLFTADQPADTLYQLVSGSLVLTDADKEQTLTPGMLPHDFILPAAYLVGAPYQTDATASSSCILISVDQNSKQGFIRCYPEVCLAVLTRS